MYSKLLEFVVGGVKMFSKFKESFNEMKSVRNLCIISLLMALRMLLRIVGSITINHYMVVGFGFLAYIIVGTMFGPFVAIIFGFLSDILCFYLIGSNGPFHWGFTLDSILSVLIYSLFLYKFKLSATRALVTQIVHDIIICVILNTYWLSQMYFQNDFSKAFLSRLPKELIVLPINCVLTVSLVVVFKRVAKGLKLCN